MGASEEAIPKLDILLLILGLSQWGHTVPFSSEGVKISSSNLSPQLSHRYS